MVNAFDALIQASGAENYVEQTFTATDPALEEAIEAGLPSSEWPPLRRYTIIVITPDGMSPHELRKAADARADALAAELAAIRAAGVDPGLLRWCDWPGCWRSYEAMQGPVDDPGWMRHPHPNMLLCPVHDQAGHRPSFDDWTRGEDFLTARCGCGDSAVVRPSNHLAVIDWWTAHITELTSGQPET
jgi:hypothetical protein